MAVKRREKMKPGAAAKMIVDGMMTLGLLFLMGYQLWGESAHEGAGAGMLLLFLAHNFLNRSWRSMWKTWRATMRCSWGTDLVRDSAHAGVYVPGVL